MGQQNNPYAVTPARAGAIMPGFNLLKGAIKNRGEAAIAQAKDKKTRNAKKIGTDIMMNGTPTEMAEFMIAYPEIGKDVESAIGFKNDETKRRLIETARGVYTGELDPVEGPAAHADALIKEGADASHTMELVKTSVRDPEMGREEAGKIWASLDPKGFTAFQKAMLDPAKAAEEALKIGSQEILEDGSIIQSTSKGPVVYNPEGVKVTGKQASETVAQARSQKVSNLRKAAGEKKTATLEAEQELKGKVEAGVINAKEAAKISVRAFTKLSQIDTNIRNLDEGIKLLREEGANTGVMDKYLPSIKSASIKLNNLQGRLGLDVLNTTTFGALSAGELKFALDTAIPVGLQPTELADWLEEKKAAQEKLSDYVESSAIFLGTPGNTVKDWIVKQKEKTAQEKKPSAQGPTLQDFLQKAAAANPGASEQELTEYYNKEYGGL